MASQPFNATLTLQSYDTTKDADRCPPGLGPGEWHCPSATGKGVVRGLGRVSTRHRAELNFSNAARERRLTGTITLGRRGDLSFTADLVADTEHSFSTGEYAYRFTGGTGVFESVTGSGRLSATGSAVDITTETLTGTIDGPSVPPLDLTPPAARVSVRTTAISRGRLRLRATISATDASAADGFAYSLAVRAGAAVTTRRGTFHRSTRVAVALRPGHAKHIVVTATVTDSAANTARVRRSARVANRS